MGAISVSEGRVCIIQVKEVSSVKENLDQIKNALIDFTTSKRVIDSGLHSYIFVDLSPFNIINSSLIGILGSIIMEKQVQLLGLCGIQPPVADILKRFGVITDGNGSRKFASPEINDNLGKVLTFKTIKDGLASLASN